MTKEELLKQVLGCPFCGEVPEFRKSIDGYIGLFCANKQCNIAECHAHGENYEELLTKWNTRAKV
jgi:hypothetical protein